jgi:hypothetical protein
MLSLWWKVLMFMAAVAMKPRIIFKAGQPQCIYLTNGYIGNSQQNKALLCHFLHNPESLLNIGPPYFFILIIFTWVGHLMTEVFPFFLFLYTCLLYLCLFFPYILVWNFPHWSFIQKILSFIPWQTFCKLFWSHSETFTTTERNVKDTSSPSCGSEPALSSRYAPLYLSNHCE